MMKILRPPLALLSMFLLMSCGGGSSDTASACPETGTYACKSGATEPLYSYQWALNAVKSFFADYPLVSDGTTDLNVEEVHLQGIKGQGINVLVLDDGLEINHIDLKDNVNRSMTWNFATNTADPTPINPNDAHGTNVSGMIAAVQNGIGVMGVAPRVTLGGAKYIDLPEGVIANDVEAYGGAIWSKNADVFNASFGNSPTTPSSYDQTSASVAALQSFPNLRNGKGAVMVKSAGNEFKNDTDQQNGITYACPQFIKGASRFGLVSCFNPSSDTDRLELPVVVIAAGNAKGYKSSYSSAGSVLWATGLGGESVSIGNYGEAGSAADDQGPQIYSTDLMGCERGYSKDDISAESNAQFMIGGSSINKAKNPQCDFDQMNGTSSSAPTVTGVVALMLSANPNLGWRDVRDILRRTARVIDAGYGGRDYRNHKINLTLNPTITNETGVELIEGATTARIDYGWQTNAVGNKYSNWYGFGLVNAKAAVQMAKSYTAYKPTKLRVPAWKEDATGEGQVNYGQVSKLGSFNIDNTAAVDMVQLLFQAAEGGSEVCMGSVGIFLKSPSGTVSVLNTPYNAFYDKTDNPKDARDGGKISDETQFVLGSYAFYGESGKGAWTVYAVSGTPLQSSGCLANPKLKFAYRIYNAE